MGANIAFTYKNRRNRLKASTFFVNKRRGVELSGSKRFGGNNSGAKSRAKCLNFSSIRPFFPRGDLSHFDLSRRAPRSSTSTRRARLVAKNCETFFFSLVIKKKESPISSFLLDRLAACLSILSLVRHVRIEEGVFAVLGQEYRVIVSTTLLAM